MAKKILTDLDLDQVSTINQGGFEKVAGNPSAPVDGQEWYDTTDDKRKVRVDTTTETYAFESWVVEEINKLERIQGSFSAAAGLLPTSANKINGDLTQIVPGDYWIISTAGTIAGIVGADQLSVGDKLQYVGGGVSTASNWVGIQTNLNDDDLGGVKSERQTVNLVANTPLTVTAAVIADIHSVQVFNSAGLEIVVGIDRSGAANTRILTSKRTLSNVVVELLG
jgi:hypothetical protein